MAILEILTYPNNFLRDPTKPVENINENILELIENMAETMYAAPGAGLAAIQVGSDKSIIVFDPTSNNVNNKKQVYQVLINPEIVSCEGEFISENEGCLSVLDFQSNVKRAAKIKVKGLNREGKSVGIEAGERLAMILQHEIDHLNGILVIDRISALKRELYKRRIKKKSRDK